MSVLLDGGSSWTEKVKSLEKKVERLDAQLKQALKRLAVLERKQGVTPQPHVEGEEDVQCRVC